MRRMFVASLTALGLAGCTGSAEQPILNQLFTASRLHDTTTLNGFSMVEIDPHKQGSVLEFTIISVTSESRAPLVNASAAKFDGEMLSKDVTVNATVRQPNGSLARKTYVVTLQRAALKGPQGDINGRWIVTNVKEASTSRSPKTS